MNKYEKTIKLHHDEAPAKINLVTGEFSEIKSRPNNIPDTKVLDYAPKDRYFRKMYDDAWNYLLENLTPVELKIVVKMTIMAKMNSNSLKPLNDSSTTIEIAEAFDIHRNHVKRIFRKLLLHGIYSEYKFGGVNGIEQYWVLNPYISFKGRTRDKGIDELFEKAKITVFIKSLYK